MGGVRELPERGELVRIVAGELAGEEATVEDVGRDKAAGRTLVRLRIRGFPWPIEEPAYAVVKSSAYAAAKRARRSHRWGAR